MLKRFADVLFARPQQAEEAPPDRVPIATCVILIEAACSDDEFSDAEREHILNVLVSRFGLSHAEALDLMHEALEAREKSSDLWHFTHEINTAYTPAEKVEIMEEVWRIFYSDGVLGGYEDHLAHKLQDLLNLNRRQLIDAKMRVLKEIRGT